MFVPSLWLVFRVRLYQVLGALFACSGEFLVQLFHGSTLRSSPPGMVRWTRDLGTEDFDRRV